MRSKAILHIGSSTACLSRWLVHDSEHVQLLETLPRDVMQHSKQCHPCLLTQDVCRPCLAAGSSGLVDHHRGADIADMLDLPRPAPAVGRGKGAYDCIDPALLRLVAGDTLQRAPCMHTACTLGRGTNNSTCIWLPAPATLTVAPTKSSTQQQHQLSFCSISCPVGIAHHGEQLGMAPSCPA